MTREDWNLDTERCRRHGSFHCGSCLGVRDTAGPNGGRGSLTTVMLQKKAYREQVDPGPQKTSER